MQRAAPRHFSMLRELPPGRLLHARQRGLRRRRRVPRDAVRRQRRAAPISSAPRRSRRRRFVFDVLDGRIARARHQHSALGRELDSLSDVISFGVAPAALGFAAGMQGGWDVAALVYFVCCGVSRLARYNVTAESTGRRRRQGEVLRRHADSHQRRCSRACWRWRPGRTAWATRSGAAPGRSGPWELHPLALLFVLSGSLMISKTLRIPKL